MASSYTKLGLVVAINGLSLAFVATSLLRDGGDLQATVSRAYLVLMMGAPMALLVLLALPPLHRDAALKGAAVVACAALLVASLDLTGDPGAVYQAKPMAPSSSQLARH